VGLGLLALVLALGCLPTASAQTVQVGVVRSLAGSVECRRQGLRQWVSVPTSGLILGPGDQLRTGGDGSCYVVIGGTQIKVGPKSVVHMPAAAPRGGVWHALRILVGKVVIRIFGDRQNDIVTPAAKASASGTWFQVEVDDDGVTTVTVAEGVVNVSNEAGQVALKTDQQTTVVPGMAPTAPVTVNAQQTMMWQADLPELPLAPEIRLAPDRKREDLPGAAQDALQSAAGRPDDLQAQLEAAAVLHDAGRLPEAEAAARRAVQLDANSAQAKAFLALVLLAEGRATEALEALAGAPAGAWADLASGLIALRAGGAQVQGALALLGAAAAELPEASLHQALAAMRLGEAGSAASAVARALEQRPGDARALALQAVLCLSQGRLEEAARSAQAAAEAEPGSALAQEALASVALFSGDLEAACDHARRAVELAPGSASAHAVAADAYTAGDDLDAALDEALTAVAVDPALGPAWRVLGTVYAAKGVYPKAASSLERALELQPRMVSAYSTLGVVYSRQGKVAKALDQLQTALSLGSASPQLENDLGALLVNLGRFDEGITHLNWAVELAEESGAGWAMPYGNLALAYLDLNRFAEAEENVLRAMELGGRSAPIHTIAGRVYMEQQRYQRAEAEFREALELDPTYALARVKLAEVYHLRGSDRQAAKESLRAGLTDAGAMVEERFYSRTELRAQAGSRMERLKTDGRAGAGRVGYFLSVADEDLPRWRRNGDFESQSAQLLAGAHSSDDSNDFLRVTYDRTDSGRPGSVDDPDPNYTTRAHQTVIELGRRQSLGRETELSWLARYRETDYRATNPDSQALDPATAVLLDAKPYLHRETDETRLGGEINLRCPVGDRGRLTAGVAGEWGNGRARGLLWQVRDTPGGPVAGHFPYRMSEHQDAWTGYVELALTDDADVFYLGGLVADTGETDAVWRPRAAWRRDLSANQLLWLSTYPVVRDDVSWLSPTDPWRQDHGIEWINFAPGGYGQFYEARYQLRGGREDLLDLVGFYRQFEDLLVYVASPRWNPEGGYYVVSDGSAYGAQLTYERPLCPRLTLAGQATYTRSDDDATGGDVPYLPCWGGRLSAHYKDPAGWRAEAVWRYVGGRYHLTGAGAYARLGSYNTLDARLSRQINTSWEVYLLGTNLLDRRYEHWLGFPELGRHVVLGFEHRF